MLYALVCCVIVGVIAFAIGRYSVRETFGSREALSDWTRTIKSENAGRKNEVYGSIDSEAVRAILKDFD